MADPKGFLKTQIRELPKRRPVPIRLMDSKEVYEAQNPGELQRQAGRCMDCGVAFCHQGCPLGNLIPEWNDAVWRGDQATAIARLHATNNFPEFTGRLCPAPCEAACVLGINQPAVTIKQVEVSIIDQAFADGAVVPVLPDRSTGKSIAIVGSGPAGLAAAQQLTRAGHTVVVYERDDRLGGLLRYGIPDFKLEKVHIDKRIAQMEAEGTRFRTGVNVGVDITWADLRARFDAVVVAGGAQRPRDLPVPGRELRGIHFAMDYLVQANRFNAGDPVVGQIQAKGKRVVVLGGGDTGADCVGTAHRQGAVSVTSIAIGKRPSLNRSPSQPWPTFPTLFEVSSAHEEGGERKYLATTLRFVDDGNGTLTGIELAETDIVNGVRCPKPGSEHLLEADLVLIALGFEGAESESLKSQLGKRVAYRGSLAREEDFSSELDGVFIAGDAGRGQSLIVWAIAEGRSAAASVDRYLLGETQLPSPVEAMQEGFSLVRAGTC
ncbi:MAG: glutamate synthase subunit beta [Microbacteriaceae bacterium]